MTLRDCPAGGELLLRWSTAEPAQRRLFAERGLVPGARVRVIARGPAGGVLVAVDDGRLALDARTAGCIVVEPPGHSAPGHPAPGHPAPGREPGR